MADVFVAFCLLLPLSEHNNNSNKQQPIKALSPFADGDRVITNRSPWSATAWSEP